MAPLDGVWSSLTALMSSLLPHMLLLTSCSAAKNTMGNRTAKCCQSRAGGCGGSSSPRWMGDSHGALSLQAEPFTYLTALAAACRASVTLTNPLPILEHFLELQVVFKHLLHFQQSP